MSTAILKSCVSLSEIKVLSNSDVFRRYWDLGPDEDERDLATFYYNQRGELRAPRTILSLLGLEKEILCVNGIETSLPSHIWSVYAPAISSVTLVAKIFDLAYVSDDSSTFTNPFSFISASHQVTAFKTPTCLASTDTS
ncbi:hypothetical protein ARMGADRAFT_1169105 [Armillaria gallica]|uniref:Uncharacterized protein n=1 Tax=Armillaria gallica TaxID=47427 RepID=A0A2H3DGT6_ARMGA|nr:hypothetical protein ARMGADRAFT_1169105 [Armillaria gallica]